MKTTIWYTLSPQSSVLEFDKNAFESAIEITGEQWYEFIQEFSRNDITAYRTIVLPNISLERLKEVEELYHITPTETRKFSDDDIHYIFESVKALPKSRAIRFANTLSELYINQHFATIAAKDGLNQYTDTKSYLKRYITLWKRLQRQTKIIKVPTDPLPPSIWWRAHLLQHTPTNTWSKTDHTPIINLIYNGEKGFPEYPRATLIGSTWVDRKSVG
jgi:hypothetical protein